MELQEIERQARALMTHHGVGRLEFAFSNGKTIIGETKFRRFSTPSGGKYHVPFRITLSRYFAERLSADEIRECMLHEIAHALVGIEHGHDEVWQATARKIGATGNRCQPTGIEHDYPVRGYCTNPDCNVEVCGQHRLPQRVYWHKKCGRSYPLRWFKNGRMMKLSDMPVKYQNEYRKSFATNRNLVK